MDVYRQASEIIKLVREGKGNAKALCLAKEMQKKRQTYAVVCETIRHYDLLEDILQQSEFFKYFPRANRGYALCMAYDAVIGKGLNVYHDSTAQAIQKSVSYLRDAYWNVKKHHNIIPREKENLYEGFNGSGSGSEIPISLKLPRYARVNTLKITTDELVSKLLQSREKRPREEEDDGEEDEREHQGTNSTGFSDPSGKPVRRGPRLRLPAFETDSIIPDLLVFPSGTNLYSHPAVRRGQLVLQDRSSCLPACILLDAVPVELTLEKKGDRPKLEYIIDACAAPGNKTSQLAALGAPDIKIMAIERDEQRANLLSSRMKALGAMDYVNPVNMDFFNLSSDDRNAAEGILLDPSCTSSGVISRADITSKWCDTIRAEERELENTEEASSSAVSGDKELTQAEKRIASLAKIQRSLLTHALLSFDVCRTVVYSTCSIHEEENENVVRHVLSDDRIKARGWTLSNIMPNLWQTRGIQNDEDTINLAYTIRCDPVKDLTNGFYVARFDRTIAS